MTLPATISTGTSDKGTSPKVNFYMGPFKSSEGAYYVVLVSNTSGTTYRINVVKATDPESTWTIQDSSNAPGIADGQSTGSQWVFQVGDVLHIANYWIPNPNTPPYDLDYATFNMATDAWTTAETIVAADVLGPTSVACSIAVRSDGDKVVEYNGDTEREMGTDYDRVYYAREEGSGWTIDVKVDLSDQGGVYDDRDWFGSVIVKGSNDRMHFFFKDGADDDAYQRTLTSGNSLESLTAPSDAGDTSANDEKHIFAHGISYDDGGTQRIRVPYRDSDDSISYAEFNSVDAPGAFSTTTGVSDVAVKYDTLGSVLCCAVSDGIDEYLVYLDSATSDLWYDKNVSTDVEHRDNVSGWAVSCNVYDRGGAVLAMVYRLAPDIKYDEVDISASISSLADVDFPLRSYDVGPFKT